MLSPLTSSCAEEEFTLFSRVVIILEFICNDDGRAYLLVTTDDVERALIRGVEDNDGWQEVEDENASTTVDVLLIVATAIDRAVAVDIKEVFTIVACGSDDDTLVVITADAPLPAVIQDDTIYACSFESIALSANAPVIGSGMWSSNSGITFSSPNNFNTNAALSGEGWQMATFTISSGGCPSTSDSVMIFSSTQAVITNIDTTVCLENDLFTVYGNNPTADETGSWYFISGFGNITSSNSPSTEINSLELGTNWLIYEISHQECESTYDTLVIAANICDGFNPVIPTVITPNFDGVNDQFIIKNLDLVHPDCEVVIFNRWGSVVFESEGYSVPWNGTRDGEPLPMGTYFYKIKLNDSENSILSGDISIIH